MSLFNSNDVLRSYQIYFSDESSGTLFGTQNVTTFFKYDDLQHLVVSALVSIFLDRSSHPEVFCKKGVLKKFAKFTGKHLCQSLFLKSNFIKKETLAQAFSCEFYEISKNNFFKERLQCSYLSGNKYAQFRMQVVPNLFHNGRRKIIFLLKKCSCSEFQISMT